MIKVNVHMCFYASTFIFKKKHSQRTLLVNATWMAFQKMVGLGKKNFILPAYQWSISDLGGRKEEFI